MNNKTYHTTRRARWEIIKDAAFLIGSFAACYVTLLIFAACL